MIIEDYEDWLFVQEAYDLFAPYIAQRDQHNGKKTEKHKKYQRKNKHIQLVIPCSELDFLNDEDLP